MSLLTKEEIVETLTSLRKSERGYRKYGFDKLADDYLPDITKYEAMLQEKR